MREECAFCKSGNNLQRHHISYGVRVQGNSLKKGDKLGVEFNDDDPCLKVTK